MKIKIDTASFVHYSSPIGTTSVAAQQPGDRTMSIMRMYALKKIALETPVNDAQSFDYLTTVDAWERIIAASPVIPRYGDVEYAAWLNWSSSLNL